MCPDASSLLCSLFAHHTSTITKKTDDNVTVHQAALKKHHMHPSGRLKRTGSVSVVIL